jgi:hypothetical protein
LFRSVLEEKSLNLPSHKIVLAAEPARAANASENNIAGDEIKARNMKPNNTMDEERV